MINKCRYLRIRSKKHIKYQVCLKHRLEEQINDNLCYMCSDKEYRKPKTIKKVSKKQLNFEKNRFSVFTKDLIHCIENNKHIGHIDKHEIFDGKNRLKSIKYGLVIPLCRTCHQDSDIKKKWQIIGKKWFIEKYNNDLFIKEFQTKKGGFNETN